MQKYNDIAIFSGWVCRVKTMVRWNQLDLRLLVRSTFCKEVFIVLHYQLDVSKQGALGTKGTQTRTSGIDRLLRALCQLIRGGLHNTFSDQRSMDPPLPFSQGLMLCVGQSTFLWQSYGNRYPQSARIATQESALTET